MRILIFFLFYSTLSISQQNKPFRKMETFTNGELTLIADYDTAGNCYFMKNIGMNGPITMIFVRDFDAKNRETRSYWGHSNLGFMLSEMVYTQDRVYSYSYAGDSNTNSEIQRTRLDDLKNRNEFISLPEMNNLHTSNKYLNNITLTDTINRTKISYSISQEGDTSTITYTYFDHEWKKLKYRYESQTDSSWIWDIYFKYDENNNRTQSYRVESKNGQTDTTEVYNYEYDEQDQLIEDNYYYKGAFKNKTIYQYNEEGIILEEVFYEKEGTEWDVLTTYQFDKQSKRLQKKVVLDMRLPLKERKRTLVYRYYE